MASGLIVHIPKHSTPTTIDVERLERDKSYRVVFAPNGKPFSKMKFNAAQQLAHWLEFHAPRAEAGENDELPLVAMSPGLVGATHGRVFVCVHDKDFAFYWPKDAIETAAKIRKAATRCERAHFSDIAKDITGGNPVARVFGVPTCETYQEYERLGDLTNH